MQTARMRRIFTVWMLHQFTCRNHGGLTWPSARASTACACASRDQPMPCRHGHGHPFAHASARACPACSSGGPPWCVHVRFLCLWTPIFGAFHRASSSWPSTWAHALQGAHAHEQAVPPRPPESRSKPQPKQQESVFSFHSPKRFQDMRPTAQLTNDFALAKPALKPSRLPRSG